MRWLLHGNLGPAVSQALLRHEHRAQTPQEAGIETTDVGELLKAARKQQLDVITTDPALASALYEGEVGFDRTVVFLQLAGDEVEHDDAIDRLFKRYKRLSPGRLYTVTATRVKVRQLPVKS